MAVQDRDFVTARGLAQTMEEVSGGGVQFVELFNGNSSSVTLPQPFGMYKVLFVVARSNNGYGSGVCVPPDNKARFYEDKYNEAVSFNGDTVRAPYGYGVTNIYAIV